MGNHTPHVVLLTTPHTLTDRVLTVSIHKFGNKFFPGTGGLHNVGNGVTTAFVYAAHME